MEQLYAEAGCKPEKTATDRMKTVGIYIAGFICVGLIVFHGQLLAKIIGVAGAAVVFYFYKRLNYEYEYIFCDGQIDFDKIIASSKRKTMIKIDMENMEICGPVNDSQLASYRTLKTKNFSSNQKDAKIYAIIVKVNNEKIRILFDPSPKMLEAMWTKSPRKVLRFS